ncbi:MAG: Glu-tRNA(Gln) amidotransferase subunit GatD [Candidatus Aenigmatarchaeota archaeon]
MTNNYSERIIKELEEENIEPGNRIEIEKSDKRYEGILMPRIASGNQNSLIVKLDNGYNIGIRFEDNVKIKKLSSPKKKEVCMEMEFDEKKPAISMISVGGTIASRIDYETGAVKALMSPEELLEVAPELADFVNIKEILNPFSKSSEDMKPEDWVKIAELCERELNKENIKGVIVTHGTDTLHYTSAALSFMLKDLNKPVVITGAQKSSDRGSSDAGMNLICSARMALSDVAEVGVCMHGTMNDDYCLFNKGTRVRKMHTSRRDAFRPINDLPIAKVWENGKIENISDYRGRNDGKVKIDNEFEENIRLITAHPGSDGSIIDYLVSEGCKGIVVQTTGLGHTPAEWRDSISNATDKGIPIFFATQTIYGRLNLNVYDNGRLLKRAGAIPLENMSPETAYVKLGWVLGHTKKLEEVKEKMLNNYTGELSERSLPETFLY